jgi:DNA-binding response OmpR family regulator
VGSDTVLLAVDTILIIDDDPEIVEFTRKRLERSGYRVIGALDGTQGVAMAFKERPDLILLDIMMPFKDGYAVLRELKENEATRTTPVIMLTAKSGSGSVLECQECGATDYFIKPIDWEELLKYIKKYIP